MNPEELNQVGSWMDDDKDYKIGTQEEYEEFVRKRNEQWTKWQDQRNVQWDNWKPNKDIV